MYTDPSDFNIDGTTTYPDSWWMPSTGVQRGTVGTDGDYLTPFYPAKGILKMTYEPGDFVENDIRTW